MDHLLALAASDKSIVPPLLDIARPAIATMADGERLALGIGEMGPHGEPLTTSRPLSSRSISLDFRHLSEGGFGIVQTSTINEGTVFEGKATPPYSYKRWMWGSAGGLQTKDDALDDVLAIPQFIASQRRSGRADEEIFLQFLAFLHSYRALRARVPDLDPIRRAMMAALSLIGTRYEATDGGPPKVAVAALESRTMLVASRNLPLWMRRIGSADAATPSTFDESLRVPIGTQVSTAVAVTTTPMDDGAWEELPPNCCVFIDRLARFQVEAHSN